MAQKLRGEPDSEQYFDWRTKAVREFRANPRYPRTPASQPASQPTTNATTQPTTQAAATQPAPRELTKDLEAKIIDQLIQPELERQVEVIAAAVADRLRADYEARQRKADAAPDFGTLAHLDRVEGRRPAEARRHARRLGDQRAEDGEGARRAQGHRPEHGRRDAVRRSS